MAIETPDPPKEGNSPIQTTDNVQIYNSDSEDDIESRNDYVMLPQQDEDFADGHSEVSDEKDETEPTTHLSTDQSNKSSFDLATAEVIREVWKTPPQEEPMDPQLQQEVLEAMKGFTLPSSAIPLWAKEISEEEWTRHILDRIHQSQK